MGVARVEDAQEQEFREFVTARQTALLRTAFLLTGSLPSAEDLLQTALTKTYLAWPRIKDKSLAERYVRTTMSRTWVSWWRRRSHTERVSETLPDVAFHDAPGEDRDEVWQALATLSVRQRAVLVLRFYEDLSEAEIADVLGCSPGAVKSHASRGLKALRAVLGDAVNGVTR
jgi:RNA polymerase sigma-70 factor (ECF subfamily)